MAEFSGIPEGNYKRFAVVGSRFNETVTRALVDGALDCLVRHGAVVEDVDVVWVPGAWELPAAAARLAASDRYAAIVACGAVVRGDTPHFDFISTEATRGLGAVQHDYNIPVGFGLLTCDTLSQAEERAGGGHGNKGWDAALAALEMSDLFARLDVVSPDEEDDGSAR